MSKLFAQDCTSLSSPHEAPTAEVSRPAPATGRRWAQVREVTHAIAHPGKTDCLGQGLFQQIKGALSCIKGLKDSRIPGFSTPIGGEQTVLGNFADGTFQFPGGSGPVEIGCGFFESAIEGNRFEEIFGLLGKFQEMSDPPKDFIFCGQGGEEFTLSIRCRKNSGDQPPPTSALLDRTSSGEIFLKSLIKRKFNPKGIEAKDVRSEAALTGRAGAPDIRLISDTDRLEELSANGHQHLLYKTFLESIDFSKFQIDAEMASGYLSQLKSVELEYKEARAKIKQRLRDKAKEKQEVEEKISKGLIFGDEDIAKARQGVEEKGPTPDEMNNLKFLQMCLPDISKIKDEGLKLKMQACWDKDHKTVADGDKQQEIDCALAMAMHIYTGRCYAATNSLARGMLEVKDEKEGVDASRAKSFYIDDKRGIQTWDYKEDIPEDAGVERREWSNKIKLDAGKVPSILAHTMMANIANSIAHNSALIEKLPPGGIMQKLLEETQKEEFTGRGDSWKGGYANLAKQIDEEDSDGSHGFVASTGQTSTTNHLHKAYIGNDTYVFDVKSCPALKVESISQFPEEQEITIANGSAFVPQCHIRYKGKDGQIKTLQTVTCKKREIKSLPLSPAREVESPVDIGRGLIRSPTFLRSSAGRGALSDPHGIAPTRAGEARRAETE